MILFTFEKEKASDLEFMEQLYTRYRRIMLRTALGMANDLHAAEDLVQDSLEKLIKKVDVLRGMERCILTVYIVYTVRNTAINYLRRQKLEYRYMESEDLDDAFTGYGDIISSEDAVMLRERQRSFKHALDMLPQGERDLLKGKYILGLNDCELAGILGCKTGSIRMKLTRARRHALEALKKEEFFNEQT